MSEFLVELYVPKTSWDAVAGASERLRRSTAELTAEGRPVDLVRSIFVPEDETCFLLMEAASVDVVREAARRAAVSYERVAETALGLRSD